MNPVSELAFFSQLVRLGSLAATARELNLTPPAVSKRLAQLEQRLGVRLLNRTTRQFSLTEAGHTYYKRASEIVREVDSLADTVRESSGDVKGRIKLTAPRTLADAEIGQSLIDFAVEYPDISLDIHLDDRFVDLVEEGFDMAIRITRMEDSSLIARRLCDFSITFCASPAYLERYGAPRSPEDLTKLPCIIDTNGRWYSNWPFQRANGEMFNIPVSGPIEVNSPLATRAAAISGLGIAPLPDFIAADALRDGRLVSVLEDWVPKGGGVFAVYPHRRYLPAKVRVLVDFLAKWFKEHGRA